jgi:hypothetical protein
MVVSVQTDIMLRDRADHIPPAAALPQPRLLTDYVHRSGGAVIGEHGCNIARNIV